MTITLRRNRVAVLFIIVFIVFMAHLGCVGLSGECNNDVVQEVLSPNKKYKAIVFQRDCGATTGFSTQISVLSITAKLPNDGGNIFICDSDHGKAPSGLGGGPPVLVEWKNENSLIVTYDSRSRVFSSISHQQGVTISYQQKLF